MSSHIFRTSTACGLVLFLSACGGGGGGSDGTPPTTPAPTPDEATQAEMIAGRDALRTAYTDPTVYTALSTIPTSGTAVYNGYFYGDLANTGDTITDTLIGALEMDVTFTTSSANVTGSVSNIVDDNGDALSGSLALGSSRLDRSGNPANDATLLVGASGTLTDSAGRDLIVGTQLEGDFLASSHRAVGGDVLGSVTVDGIDQNFDGGFVAER